MESNGSIWLEPMKPQPAPVIQDKSVPDPNPQIVQPKIGPNPKAGGDWRKQVKPVPADPKDVVPSNPTGIVKI